MYRKILVPVDGSPLGEAALEHAARVARAFGSKLILLQVATSVPIATADPMVATGAEVAITLESMDAAEDDAEEYLGQLSGYPILEGLTVSTTVLRGAPAEEIVRYAQAERVDMIAMSTHGRSGLGRLVFGSVADEVLRRAGVPILLVRPLPEHEKGEPREGGL